VENLPLETIAKSGQSKIGRPSKYSKTIVKNILELLSKGESIRSALKKENITWRTWRTWMDKYELRNAYVEAKQDGIDYTIADAEQIAKQTIDKAAKKEIDLATVKAVDTYLRHKQWVASKLAPKTFGTDKQQISLTGSNGQKLEIEWQKD
jgi:hypothetical protein|tara:strand:- start:1377 stop:1829 length:453 start_codon:yes stop_codon:yes gene_type:complete